MFIKYTIVVFFLGNVASYKTSTCVRKHEEFSLCGRRCPPTCVNLRLFPTDLCPSTWECRVGCRCSAGFVRDEYSKHCILVQNCPVTGAPALTERTPSSISQQQIEEYLRNRRSQYGNQYGAQYASPCAAASYGSSVAGPAYHQDHHGYMHQPYAYGAPHYRSIEAHFADPEMLSFSDFDQFMPEHIPMARLGGYGAPPAAILPSASTMNQIVPATSATVYGVFPNANVGGYNVPLLFSCSPTIVPGHMMEAQSPTASIVPAPDSYRGVDDLAHLRDINAHHEELTSQEHLSTVHEPSKVAPYSQ